MLFLLVTGVSTPHCHWACRTEIIGLFRFHKLSRGKTSRMPETCSPRCTTGTSRPAPSFLDSSIKLGECAVGLFHKLEQRENISEVRDLFLEV